MKLTKTISLIVVISIFTMLIVSFSTSAAPINQIAEKVASTVTPSIDGKLNDSIWKDGFRSFENEGSENRYKYAWDDKCLYLAFDLKDSTPCFKEDKTYKDDDNSLPYYSYEYDCVGFYFSPTNSKTTFAGNDVQFLYTLNPDGGVALRVGGGPSNQKQRLVDGLYSKSVMKCERTADGWTLEVAMNWDELLAYKTVLTDPDSSIREEDKSKMFSAGLAFQDAEFASPGIPAEVSFDKAGKANWQSFENEDSLILSNQMATSAADNFDFERIDASDWRGYIQGEVTKYNSNQTTYEVREILKDNIDLTGATIDVKFADGDADTLQQADGYDNDFLVDSVVPIAYYRMGGVFYKDPANSLNLTLPEKDIEITLTLPEAVYMDRIDLWGVYKEGENEPANPNDPPQNGGLVRGMPMGYTIEVADDDTSAFTKVADYSETDVTKVKVDNKYSFANQKVKIIKLHITKLNTKQEAIGDGRDAYILMLGELAAYNMNVRPDDPSSSSESSGSESSSSESSSSVNSSPDSSDTTSTVPSTSSVDETKNNPSTGDNTYRFILIMIGTLSLGVFIISSREVSKKYSGVKR